VRTNASQAAFSANSWNGRLRVPVSLPQPPPPRLDLSYRSDQAEWAEELNRRDLTAVRALAQPLGRRLVHRVHP
jgi:hypothetical protein